MKNFYDPSIKPIVTTDIDGNILNIRTHGLYYYGYPDVILETAFDHYEEVFELIITSIFNFTFDFKQDWNLNGKMISFDLKDGIAHVKFECNLNEVRIVTFVSPNQSEPHAHKTNGLFNLFRHPEFQISANVIHGKMLLAHVVDEVKNGFLYDEDSIISLGEREFGMSQSSEKVGKSFFEILEIMPACSSNQYHLKLV